MSAGAATKQQLGERIRALRQARKWSQEELARRVGVARPAVSMWESGDTKNIKNDNLVNLAKAFEMTLDELLSRSPAGVRDAAQQYGSKIDSKLLRECIELVEDALAEYAGKISAATKATMVDAAYNTIGPDGKIDKRKVMRLIVKEL